MHIAELLNIAVTEGASDLFLCAGKVPVFRKNGELMQNNFPPLAGEDLLAFRRGILSPDQEDAYNKNGAIDASCSAGQNRFRINFFHALAGHSAAIRPVLSARGLSFEKLNLPPVLAELCNAPRGLLLLSGATGCGKSTTLATMINYINQHRKCHILTLEDPVEFVHQDAQSLISQREINTDTVSFSAALYSAMRENPDVIVIGEMRDQETMQNAVNAALSGHLVISTLHTADTIQAVERMIQFFPEHLRDQAAINIGEVLVAILSQRLIPAAAGDGMYPAMEILRGTAYVRKLIAERDYASLEDVLRRNTGSDMMVFNRAIYKLYTEGKITLDAGRAASSNPDAFNLLAKGMESGEDSFRNYYSDHAESADKQAVDMRRLLRTAIKTGASDLLLSYAAPPTLRLNGELRPLELPPLSRADIRRLLFSILNPAQRVELESKRELDLALSVTFRDRNALPDGSPSSRFRVNAFYQKGCLGVVCRVINTRIPSPQALTLPPAFVRLAMKQQGLVLVTGPTGSGKSTTLASMINEINCNLSKHIITIEDPIEFVHENVRSIVEQRELHSDTMAFSTALKYALRQDPDVILVGEMRDTETMAAALTAAETGHLVFATIHTNSAPQTIDRIVDSFPTGQQNQIRLQLAGVLLGVLSQRLLPRQDVEGRAAAFEVMLGTPPVLALVRDGKTHQLQSVIETSWKDGMCTLEKSLEELYSAGKITRDQVTAFRADYKATREF